MILKTSFRADIENGYFIKVSGDRKEGLNSQRQEGMSIKRIKKEGIEYMNEKNQSKLKTEAYTLEPLRRTYILKPIGRRRPLSILTDKG